jgi:hypothetical protein
LADLFRQEAFVVSKGENADDFAGASAEVLDLIVCESDKRVAAQVQLMLANDQRANGILAAAATLAAAGLAVAGTQLGTDANWRLLSAATVFASLATMAAMAAVWALWPKGVEIQGWSPRLFVDDVRAKKDPLRMSAEIAALNQQKIAGNDLCNASLSRRIKVAMALLVAAPFGSALVLLVSGLCR